MKKPKPKTLIEVFAAEKTRTTKETRPMKKKLKRILFPSGNGGKWIWRCIWEKMEGDEIVENDWREFSPEWFAVVFPVIAKDEEACMMADGAMHGNAYFYFNKETGLFNETDDEGEYVTPKAFNRMLKLGT